MITTPSLITTYLEMRSPDQLRPNRADARFQVREKTDRDWRFNRDLYFRVGEQWNWIDKRPWTDEQWKKYAAAPELRTFAAYDGDAFAGYYELRQDTEGGVEIAYFGLLPEFIGRGLGGALLTSAISLIVTLSRSGGPAAAGLHLSVCGCIRAIAIIRRRWRIIRRAGWSFTKSKKPQNEDTINPTIRAQQLLLNSRRITRIDLRGHSSWGAESIQSMCEGRIRSRDRLIVCRSR